MPTIVMPRVLPTVGAPSGALGADQVGAPPVDLTESVRRLSRGHVVDIRRSGPVFDKQVVRRRLRRDTFTPVLTTSDRVLAAVLGAGWLICLAVFWAWWLQPAHRSSWAGLLINSAVLFYLSALSIYFVFGVNRLKRTSPGIELPPLRVAFVVIRAPSEPWDVARSTLQGLLAQNYPYPYDVWLCDESPDDEIRQWCEWHRVRLSSRFGVEAYHRKTWPRRTKCKEGNLAYFYDRFGYANYDVVSQLDCDHVPAPTYLSEMVRPFADDAIGYVAAPSVCDTNADRSWSARGRLHREATFHGPHQLGHNAGLAPLCIGSHYAVRTTALRDIGGIGPDLAEDFSTTFLLNSAGWEGAFAIDAEAHGDGPLTFSAMCGQEFQWARSVTTVMLSMVPRHMSRLSWKLRIRFMFAQTYYFLLTITTVGGLALAPIAAVTGQPWVKVNYAEFLLHWWSISFWLIAMALLLRRRGLLRPRKAPIFSWENSLYHLVRWPYFAWGVVAGVLQEIRPRQLTYRVTPKAVGDFEQMPLRLTMPYLLVSLVMTAASLYAEFNTNAAGYVFLCLVAATTYSVVAIVVPLLHAGEAARLAGARFSSTLRTTATVPLSVACVAALPVVAAIALFPPYFLRVFS